MLTDEQFSRLSQLVTERLGLDYAPSRQRDLEHGLAAAAAELRFSSVASFSERLLTDRLNPKLTEALAGHLTVGETYFFRHPEALTALQERILPEFIRCRQEGSKRLTIWSAGCSSGEEPYTIAILLDRLLTDQSEWQISIVGTDINAAALEKAREGIYSEWSFRGTPGWLKRRYFRQMRSGKYQLLPEIRQRVEFRHLNLVAESYPLAVGNGAPVDLILCRNVLMYFAPATAKEVARRFHLCLGEGGWLLTSPTEAWGELFPEFDRVRGSGSVLFRKRDGPMPPAGVAAATVRSPSHGTKPASRRKEVPHRNRSAKPATRPPAVTGGSTSRQPLERDRKRAAGRRQESRYESAESISSTFTAESAPAEAAASKALALASSGRDHADNGRLLEAAEDCSRAVQLDKTNASLRYLLGVIEIERGNSEPAARAFTQAVYLEPDVALPHVALANLRQAQGRYLEAGRHFTTALRLLRARPAAEQVADSEGLTAGELSQLVEAALAELRRRTHGGRSGRTMETRP
ncbi:MAG: CheR family methyltransferase [Trueperaceae bacterium]